jgi:sigma-B regulation protein RsbU (phosphoserine phosphatase)
VLRLEEPGAVLGALNEQLAKGSQRGMFVTLACAIIDPDRRAMQVANAGHLPPLVRPAGGGKPEALETGIGPPLGVLEGVAYPAFVQTLEAGQVVAFYSDGVIEAQAPDGSFYGMERLEELLASTSGLPGEVCDKVVEAVRAFMDGRDQHDDLTLVTFGARQ